MVVHYYGDTRFEAPNDSSLAVYYLLDEAKKHKNFYMWFADYRPVKLGADAWIDIDIEWQKGQPLEQPQLYCVMLKNDRQNAPSINYREKEYKIFSRDYNEYLHYLDMGLIRFRSPPHKAAADNRS